MRASPGKSPRSAPSASSRGEAAPPFPGGAPFFSPRLRPAFRHRFEVSRSIPHSDLTGWGTVHIMFLAGRAGGKVDAWDLKSQGANPCGFESRARHQEGIAGWSSQEARRAHNPKVAGSNPAPATNGGVAQLARACGSYPQCHWFNSSHRHQGFKAVHRPGGPLFSYRPHRFSYRRFCRSLFSHCRSPLPRCLWLSGSVRRVSPLTVGHPAHGPSHSPPDGPQGLRIAARKACTSLEESSFSGGVLPPGGISPCAKGRTVPAPEPAPTPMIRKGANCHGAA